MVFINGSVCDNRVIGVDRNGKDGATVATWAKRRTTHGDAFPKRVAYLEIENEFYGAKRSAPGCVSYGWEDSWTCDGHAYIGGDSAHDDFVKIRSAIRKIDPTISVGAVGIDGAQSDWGDFSNEVLDAGADALDSYVVRDDGFNAPASASDALARGVDAVGKVMPVRPWRWLSMSMVVWCRLPSRSTTAMPRSNRTRRR